jgi:hypothetical protein
MNSSIIWVLTSIIRGESPTFRRKILPLSSGSESKPSKKITGKMQWAALSLSLVWFTLRPWRWKWYIPPKHLVLSGLRRHITTKGMNSHSHYLENGKCLIFSTERLIYTFFYSEHGGIMFLRNVHWYVTELIGVISKMIAIFIDITVSTW